MRGQRAARRNPPVPRLRGGGLVAGGLSMTAVAPMTAVCGDNYLFLLKII